jgi:hypothetical protein
MKPIVTTVTSVVFVAGAVVTYAIVRGLQSDMTFLSLVVGAILGTQAGLYMYHRQPDTFLTTGIKTRLGGVVAVTGVALSFVMQAVFHWFQFPAMSIPIGAIGCFVFPFVISEGLWKAIGKSRKKSGGNG